MSHLGEKISEWADGRFSGDEALRVVRHLERCTDCRDLADTERLTKARLAALLDPVPEPTFLVRLAAMGGPNGPLAQRPGHLPGTPRTVTVASPRAVAKARSDVGRPLVGGQRKISGAPLGRRRGSSRGSVRPGEHSVPAWSTAAGLKAGILANRRRAGMISVLALVGLGVVGVGAAGISVPQTGGLTVAQVAPALISWVTSGGHPNPPANPSDDSTSSSTPSSTGGSTP